MNILYTSPKCTYCPAVKEYLAKVGISYEERNVADPIIREEVISLGVRTVPTFVKGEKIFLGDDILTLT